MLDNSEQPRQLKKSRLILIGILVFFILLQFVRFFVPLFKIENPPTVSQIQWDSPRTQTLWNSACNDCHSNQTDWRWYTFIAPVGWLTAYDVNEGRDELNISEGRIEGEEMAEVIREGEMPPAIYAIIHPDAKLNDAEKQEFIDGLRATFGMSADDDD